MTYYILRKYCQFILKLITKKIEVKGLENLPKNGAVLLASNHPNSFLDAIVINCIVPRPVWSLARGDAFKKPLIKAFLSKIFMMPIYRISEGREYLGKNDETFQKCYNIFENGGQVLIFSEGICSNQTALLPLKKGTGRLTLQTWQSGLDLKILPVGINYDQYFKFGKTIQLNFGESFDKKTFEDLEHEGYFLKSFNEILKNKLEPLFDRKFTPDIKPSIVIYYLGWLLNFPLYLVLNVFVSKKTKGSVFFDAAFYGFLIIGIPIYWLFLWLIYSIII